MAGRIETVADLVEAFGGTGKFADWLDVVPSTVSNWKELGKIPTGWHLRLYLECKDRGFAVSPGLFGIKEKKAPRPTKRAEARASA